LGLPVITFDRSGHAQLYAGLGGRPA